jgi:hypothetical protein
MTPKVSSLFKIIIAGLQLESEHTAMDRYIVFRGEQAILIAESLV